MGRATALYRILKFDGFSLPSRRIHHALLFATALVGGVVGFVPIFTLFVQGSGLPIPRPALVGVAVVCGSYTLLVIIMREITLGSFVALLVFATVSANVPLAGGYYPGGLDPSIWLFYFPLIFVLALGIAKNWFKGTVTKTHMFFMAFVAWSALAAVFGAGPRLVVGLLFVLQMVVLFMVFAVMAAACAHDQFDLKTTVLVFGTAVVGHGLFTMAQLVNGDSFGITVLGEVDRFSSTTITFGPITRSIGVYLSGFTGSAAILSALILLVTPSLLLFAVTAHKFRHRWRVLAAGGSVWLFGIIRLTVKDAARGAALVTLVAVAVAAIWLHRHRIRAFGSSVRTATDGGRSTGIVAGIIAIFLSTLTQLYSISTSGRGTAIKTVKKSVASKGGGGGGGGGASKAQLPQWAIDLLARIEGTTLPLFNLQTLGVRARQYLAAIDVALRYPLFGLGGGNFSYVAFQYGLQRANRVGKPVGNAIHNMYLVVLAGTGMPGFLLFMATFATITWSAITLVRQSDAPSWLSAGVVCGLFGYATTMFWNVHFLTYTGTVPAFAIAGAVVGTIIKTDSDYPHK